MLKYSGCYHVTTFRSARSASGVRPLSGPVPKGRFSICTCTFMVPGRDVIAFFVDADELARAVVIVFTWRALEHKSEYQVYTTHISRLGDLSIPLQWPGHEQWWSPEPPEETH